MGIIEELVEIWPNKVCDITPSLGSSSIEKLSRFLVYSEDIPAVFHLYFVNYPQILICHLLECILSIWWGIHSFYVSWLGKMAKSLFIFLFFSFSFSLDLQLQGGVWESITWLCHNVTMVWWMVTDGHVTVTVTRCHMTRVTWGPWENKRIATVVKCISR